jgi:hypothetical protein
MVAQVAAAPDGREEPMAGRYRIPFRVRPMLASFASLRQRLQPLLRSRPALLDAPRDDKTAAVVFLPEPAA